MADAELRILAGAAGAHHVHAALTRRAFLAGLGTAGLALVAACRGDNRGTAATTAHTTAPPPLPASAATVAPATAVATTAGPSRHLDPNATSFTLYTPAEYDDPDVLAAFGTVTVDVFDSNDEAIATLAGAGGAGHYDVVVPGGPFVPQMVAKGLLEKLDLSLVPNFTNLDPMFTNQPWDRGNQYTICKDWGATGWLYDTQQVKGPITSWADFIKAAEGDASGKTSLLDVPADVAGVYFWANGIDWTTEKPSDLDAYQSWAAGFAPHVKRFDSFPGINLSQGNYALSQVFSSDARQGVLQLEEAGEDSSQYSWGVGAPASEIWMDNWAIVKGAKNLDAAYRFLGFILDPANSVKDVAFHGCHTGLKDLAAHLPADLKHREMIALAPEVVARLQAGALNSAHDRLVQIHDSMKAKVAG